MADANPSLLRTRPALREADAPAAPEPAAPGRAAEPAPAAHPRRRLIRWTLLVAGPLLVAVGALALWLHGGRYVSIDNAYVKADIVTVANDVAGMVARVSVTNNQPVTAGQELFRLDDEPFRIALANAEAQLAQVRNDLDALKASWRQKQADIGTDEVQVAFYDKELQRQAELVARSFVSRAQYDMAKRNLDVARQTLASDRQQLAGITANLAGDPQIAPEQHPRWQQAAAARDRATRDLRRTVVTAARDGVVTNVDKLQPGQYLPAGAAALSLVASDQLWIEANPKETELTWVKDGDPATVTVDAYPDAAWHGVVASQSPASGAEFALLPAQNTSGNWVKVVQRIPIRLAVETARGQPVLRAGMSVVATIDTGHRRRLADLWTSVGG